MSDVIGCLSSPAEKKLGMMDGGLISLEASGEVMSKTTWMLANPTLRLVNTGIP